MKQSHFFLIAIALIVIALGAALSLESQPTTSTTHAMDTTTANGAQFVRPHSPRVGAEQAKVILVEFLDPACETCRQFHPFVKRIQQRHGDKIMVVIRYAPFHQGSDQMVAILEASRKQGKFGEVLELMFDSQHLWTQHHVAHADRFWPLLENIDIDITRLKQDIQDPAIRQVIEQDLSDAQGLGANKTPTFFVNGQGLPRFGHQELVQLIEAEIAKHYP